VRLSSDALASLEGLSPTLQSCYEKGLADDPKLWGRIALKLELAADGAVKQATPVETRFPDAGVTECARQVLLSARLVSPGVNELTFAVRLGQPAPPTPPEPSPPVAAPLAPALDSPPAPPAPPPAPPAPEH
jgi:hypothetical protein